MLIASFIYAINQINKTHTKHTIKTRKYIQNENKKEDS